jgi:ABC-type nitrate/sulfonate/bicarbonate transport system, permease component
MKESLLGIILSRVGYMALASLLAIGVWIVLLEGLDVIPLIGKRPWHVWEWLVTVDDAAENREVVFRNLATTIRDAGIGYLVGITASFVVGVIFVLNRTLEQMVLPSVMLVRSIPLLVLTPLITLVFGVNLVGVSVVVTSIVFFPALINIMFGLRNVNPQLSDLVRAHGGGTFTVLVKVAIPSALPNLFASMRLSVPLAVTGAMIGEWLATGEGLGGSIARAAGTFDFNQMWASAVVIATFTMTMYLVVSIVETLVVRRFGAPVGEH